MDKVAGYDLLKIIVDKELTHEDYTRVTTLEDKYYKLKTGDGIEKLLQKIETRVTEEEFDQIKRIYRSIVPSILNSTKMPFQKACRKPPIVRSIKFPTESENKKTDLDAIIKQYWGDKSLEEYLEYALVDYNYLDPNAFLITEFEPFDYNTEKAKPYPFVASATEAVMFEYQNEILQYLVVKLPIKYLDGEIEKDGSKYTMYLGLDTIEFIQVADKLPVPEGADDVIALQKGKFFAVYYYQPKATKVPAMRFGYIRDEQTKGRTFVSVFHPVIAFLEKTLKIDSELDLSTALTAFPQRFQYVTRCKNKGCRKGTLIESGEECPNCHGTGIQPFHKGTQDMVTLEIPDDPALIIDLEKLLVYKNPPIELLQFQKDYLEYLKKSCHQMMFNADLYTRTEVMQTATEKLLETDNLNDTLYGFARQYSSIWVFTVKDIATFTDNNPDGKLDVQHKMPSDFKFKTLNELMSDLQTAKNAQASTSTISAIEDDINEMLYSDRPEELKKIRIKNDLNPFRGYSETNIRFIISNGNTTLYNRTLWENFESIMSDLELNDQALYDKSIDTIRELVQERTLEYIMQINNEKQAEMQQFLTNQQSMQGG